MGSRFFVGVTDKAWFERLKASNCDEVNFWTSGSVAFKALSENEMFLFKLHKPENCIVGGGFFVRFSILPTFLAWAAFGIKNGATSLDQLNDSIMKYRKSKNIGETGQIGCIILTEPFFFDEEDWIPAPANWADSIVRGKTYTTDNVIGAHIFAEVQERLSKQVPGQIALAASGEKYSVGLAKHRLGQGAFRIAVTDAYQRRCAITGEKTLPVLEAAHIQPYAVDGPHRVENGILLRSDIHTLFDSGYLTITPDYRVEVSDHLHDDFGNGKEYYKFNRKELLILPDSMQNRPGKDFIEWHNNHVYLG